MRSIYVSVAVVVTGLLVSWLGQGIWRTSPDELWAAVAVMSVLSAGAIILEQRVSRLLRIVTRGNSTSRLPL